MEIPFVVNARKDTGLFNSKVGIWLFLASEVTLFGGLFSGYLFLRLYADYPWPERTLPVLPGLINTFVLIGSSVTVVFAWAALKMREWKKFQIYMAITLLCAALFMVLKGVEYSAKFGHQGVQIEGDGPVQGREIVEGHIHKGMVVGDRIVDAEEDSVNAAVEEQALSRFKEMIQDEGAALVAFLTDLQAAQAETSKLEGDLAKAKTVLESKEKELATAKETWEGISAKNLSGDASEEEKEGHEKAVAAALESYDTLEKTVFVLKGNIESFAQSIPDSKLAIRRVKAALGGTETQSTVVPEAEKLKDADEAALKGLAGAIDQEKLKAAITKDLESGQVDLGYADKVAFKVSELSFVLTRPTHDAYVDQILSQAGDNHTITLAKPYRVVDVDELAEGTLRREELLWSERALKAERGAELSTDLLDDLEGEFLDARSYDQSLSTEFLRASWEWVRQQDGFSEDEKLATYVVTEPIWTDRRKEDEDKLKQLKQSASSSVTFNVDPPMTLFLDPGDLVKFDSKGGQLRDDTTFSGELLESPMIMGVDALDFRHTAQRAKVEGLDPLPVIEGTWLLTHKAAHHHGDAGEKGEGGDDRNEFRKIWDSHMAWLNVEEERLKLKERTPTDNDRFRVNWDQILAYRDLGYDQARITAAALRDLDDEVATKIKESGKIDLEAVENAGGKEGERIKRTGLFDLNGFAGANHKAYSFPHLEIPREKVGFESTFTPKWNTYYAIYFTITGLHGLHVIGGALVLGYYLFFGRKMYESNPEWLANRVEIGGLFWHFVDLVWIFLFPILYLM